MKNVVIGLLWCFASSAQGQVMKQMFVGTGVSTAWSNGVRSVVSVAGFGVAVPVSKKLFVRPVISFGMIAPENTTKPFSVVQSGCMLGYRVTKRFAALSGFAETIQVPKTGTVYLPTAMISTATRLWGRWGVYTPTAFTARGYSLSAQLGYSW